MVLVQLGDSSLQLELASGDLEFLDQVGGAGKENTPVDDMAVPAIGPGAPAGQRHGRRAADEQLQPVVVKMDAQTVADQPGRNRVKDLAQGEAA